jgi:predicted CXXCH cytochrome family protein
LVIRHTSKALYGEPTGSSRLCLSCHDGVTAGGIPLGNVLRPGGAGAASIKMLSADRIAAGSPTLFTADKIKLGHHPVSFVYDADVLLAIKSDSYKGTQNYKLPSMAEVKLDKDGRMQCTTCHDPHQNKSQEDQLIPSTQRKIAPFWVYGGTGDAITDHDAVCKDCHNFTQFP